MDTPRHLETLHDDHDTRMERVASGLGVCGTRTCIVQPPSTCLPSRIEQTQAALDQLAIELGKEPGVYRIQMAGKSQI